MYEVADHYKEPALFEEIIQARENSNKIKNLS